MLKPLHKNVILQKEDAEKETKTASGIIITEQNKKEPSYAIVKAIGPECKANIQVNDKVIFKEYSGTKVEMDHEKFIIVEDEDILAVIA